MRILLTFLLVGVISGCVSAPPENPWADLTVETDPAVVSLDCGSFPLPGEVVGNAIVYDLQGTNDLEAYRVCAEANQGIADQNAAQVDDLKQVRASLTSAGAHQRNIAQMRLEMLEDERQHNFWTTIGYWAVIIGLGAAL